MAGCTPRDARILPRQYQAHAVVVRLLCNMENVWRGSGHRAGTSGMDSRRSHFGHSAKKNALFLIDCTLQATPRHRFMVSLPKSEVLVSGLADGGVRALCADIRERGMVVRRRRRAAKGSRCTDRHQGLLFGAGWALPTGNHGGGGLCSGDRKHRAHPCQISPASTLCFHLIESHSTAYGSRIGPRICGTALDCS